ncbi:MAG: DUF427 domain-containing protein [Alphaproteobacteria bacterium]|nr:DUF427 domain-containing protein [Alphaproteobacteria bacterium]
MGDVDAPHRVTVEPCAKRFRVYLGDAAIADSVAARLLFETGLPVRPYLDRADVAMHLLRPSPTRTVCPYKGIASYYDAAIGGTVIRDAVWCYEDPFPEVGLIKGRLAFYPERVDTLEIAAR